MRALAALASTAFVLSGFRTARAEPCPPRATVDGDGVAVARVTEELRRLGVTVSSDGTGVASARPAGAGARPAGAAADGCTTIRAQVALDAGGGIAVAVHGANQGSEGRIVSDAALAAAWIDSWTRQDLDVALWAAPPRRTATAVPNDASPPAEPRRDDAPSGSPDTGHWDRIALSASYEQTWSNDDATWRGLHVSGCTGVGGGLCVGAAIRAAFDAERLYNATGVARSDLSVLAIARYPVAIGTMSIAPELGLGAGRLATRRAETECKAAMPPPNCDPLDPMCLPAPTACEPTDPGTMSTKVYVGDNFDVATYAPRIELALRIAIPLFEHVWLDGVLGYSYSPFAHTSVFEANTMADDIIAPELIALPGEPTSGYALGIGLRVGAK